MIGIVAPDQIHVMTANLRLDRSAQTVPEDPDHWPGRRPALLKVLRAEQPALLGVQEAMHSQLSALEEALPGHRLVGFGRAGGSHDEHAAICYDPRRFALLDWDQQWLSDTPRLIGSATWGNTITRILVQARLRDLRTGTELLMINTHLDHESENARVRSARMLRGLVTAQSLPVIVTGDFNVPAGASEAYTILTGGGLLQDTWEAAEERLTPAWGTFPDYAPPVEGGERIDWILASAGLRPLRAGINTSTGGDGGAPSDHAFVQAVLALR